MGRDFEKFEKKFSVWGSEKIFLKIAGGRRAKKKFLGDVPLAGQGLPHHIHPTKLVIFRVVAHLWPPNTCTASHGGSFAFP